MATTPPIERFWRLTKQDQSGCILWLGHTVGSKSSYPRFRPTSSSSDRSAYAHRWIYEQTIGPIPDGMEIDHLCGVPTCVNVDHLEPVTPAENQRRKRLDVCRAGTHDLSDPNNVKWDRYGRRRGCAQCARDRALARYYQLKAQPSV